MLFWFLGDDSNHEKAAENEFSNLTWNCSKFNSISDKKNILTRAAHFIKLTFDMKEFDVLSYTTQAFKVQFSTLSTRKHGICWSAFKCLKCSNHWPTLKSLTSSI